MKIKRIFFLIVFFLLISSAYATNFTVNLGTQSDLAEAQALSEQVKNLFPSLQICLDPSGNYIVSNGTFTTDTNKITEEIQIAKSKGFNAEIVPINSDECFGYEGFLKTNKESASPVHIKPPQFRATRNNSPIPTISSTPATTAPGTRSNGIVIQDTFIQVYPDIVTSIWLSNRDVNRIVCEGGVPVADVIYSEEKGITHKVHNDTVWLKYVALESSLTRELKYRNEPTELYVLCGADKKTYAMVVSPQFIDTQKIILKTGNKNIQTNQSLFKGLSTEEKILKLIKEAYNDEYNDSYTKKTIEDSTIQLGSLEIKATREIKVHGEGLRITEFSIWNNPECTSVAPVGIDEKRLLSLNIKKNPLLISVQKHTVFPGETTKAFIIDFER